MTKKDDFEKLLEDPETAALLKNSTSEDLIATEEEIDALLCDDIEVDDNGDIIVPVENEENLPSTEVAAPKHATKEQELEDDFQSARDNLYKTIDVASCSIEELSKLAKKSQHPRAYEVLALLAKTLTDTNKTLLDLHKQKQKIDNDNLNPSEGETNIGTQNNLIVGTTADLDEMIEKLMSGKIKDNAKD
jgi:hypothetical protein